MNEDNKYLIPKRIVLPLEQINNSFFINPLPNDEIKSISLLLLDSIYPRASNAGGHEFWQKIFENRNAELRKRMPSILELFFPKILEKIILEYLIHDKFEINDYPSSMEKWAKLTWSKDFKFPENKHFLNFPYDDEKLQRLTWRLVEEKQFPSKGQIAAVRRIILRRIFYTIPKVLIDLIDAYLGKDKQISREKRYTTEIGKFFDTFLNKIVHQSGFAVYYYHWQAAINALSAIENNSGFAPFFTNKNKKSFPDSFKISINFNSIKNSFDCLDSIILTDSVWCEPSEPQEMKITFFQVLINTLRISKTLSIKEISRLFYMLKSLVDSSRILSGNLPLNVAYHLTKDMERSLYAHVDRLGRGSKDNKKNNKPTLLTTTLGLLDEKVKDIDFIGDKGFSIIPVNLATGIRLCNYHKRSQPLDILYNYVNESKGFFSWFNGQNDQSSDAKALVIKLLNIPCASVREYVLIDEIEKSLSSNKIRDPKYKKALEQVKDVLEKHNRFKPSENSNFSNSR